jgi:uncharacterized membrane protein YozB (DUF420 family)
MTTTARRDRLVPTALILLSVIPVLGGAMRVAELSGGAEVTPANARFFAMPVPVLLHIVGATVFCVLGAFQFSAGIRRRRPAWHRRAGRLLVLCGLTAGLTGLWMTAFYQLPPGDQGLLTVLRFIFGSAMVAALVAGFLAIRRRDITRHRAWMMRGYAIGQGAGTQALLHLPWILVLGPAPTGLGRALLLGAGWLINLAVVEWFIRRQPVTSVARTRAVLVETR